MASTACAQRVLSLDSCRTLALQGNKQLAVSRLNQEMAGYARRAIRTKYLPKVDAVAGYEYVSKEVSILNNRQKNALSNLGTNAVGKATEAIASMAQQGLITPEMAQQIGQVMAQVSTPLATAANSFGQSIRNAFRTDNRNMWAGAVMVRQPIYMGGAITAANRMVDIQEQMAANDLDWKRQTTLFDIDQTYWLVVSLRQKEQLADSYRNLVKKLDEDVYKMIKEGVATRADGLKVDVKVNEAEMQLTQAENGLALAKMLLCQLCGIALDEDIHLADESLPALVASLPADAEVANTDSALAARPEIRLLQNAIDLSQASTRLIRAEYLPHVALTGGYLLSNPNVYNGFERKFAGVWNVGIVVQVPVWNWGEGANKVRAARTATQMANMELADMREKLTLQIRQCQFKVKESRKRLSMAYKNIQSAEENLRCANVGFREGVMEATDVMAAQTAWQLAQSQKIDAEIDVRMANLNLQKAMGNIPTPAP